MNEKTHHCGYCDLELTPQGYLEGTDSLGTYCALVFFCAKCGYTLEQNPVYIDDEDEDDTLTYQTVK